MIRRGIQGGPCCVGTEWNPQEGSRWDCLLAESTLAFKVKPLNYDWALGGTPAEDGDITCSRWTSHEKDSSGWDLHVSRTPFQLFFFFVNRKLNKVWRKKPDSSFGCLQTRGAGNASPLKKTKTKRFFRQGRSIPLVSFFVFEQVVSQKLIKADRRGLWREPPRWVKKRAKTACDVQKDHITSAVIPS